MSINCWTHIQNDILPIVLNSGRSIGRMGNYYGCLETKGMDYHSVMLNYDGQPLPRIGLCLPEQCKSSQIQNLLSIIFQRANVPFQVSQIHSHLDQITYPYTFSFYITIFIILSLTLLVLISSISKSFRNHKILSAFSLQNSLKIFKYHDNRLNTLNGVRSLAMMWVIFGHVYSMVLGYVPNFLTLADSFESWFFLFLQSALFSVDTFFFIGGFLVSYAVLKQTSKNPLKYPLAILNRYFRIVPSYFMAMMILDSIILHFGSGPNWSDMEGDQKACQKMWMALLFVQNLFQELQEMCLSWGWYLQNDMQLFIYSILLLFIYSKNKFYGYMAIVWSIFASFAYVMAISYSNQFHVLIHATDTQHNGDNVIYIKPWCRCPPYLYGILLGMLYSNFLSEEKKEESNHIFVRIKRKCTRSRLFRYSIEFCGLLISLFVILIIRTGQNEHFWSQLANSLYLTYAKVTFVVGLSLILLPSLLGVDSIIRFMMDTKFFNFVAKVSYCTYLVHFFFIEIWLGSFKADFYYSEIALYAIFATVTVLSIFFGLILSLLVQIPFSKLQKLFMNWLLNQNKKKQNVHDEAQKQIKIKDERLILNQSVKKQ